MVWAPTKANKEAIKFWLDCLQIVTVVAGVIAVAITFNEQQQRERDRLAAEDTRAQEQAQREKDQLDAIKRELERPYQEKKLALYLDAARVLAHLAASPNVDKESTEARFWELYWGELAFVESRTEYETKGGPAPAVERLMVDFCHKYFSPDRCAKSGAAGASIKSGAAGTSIKEQTNSVEEAAINMARQASEEIRDRWETIGQ